MPSAKLKPATGGAGVCCPLTRHGGASPPAVNEIGVAGVARRGAVVDDLVAARRRRRSMVLAEPVVKSGVGALAGTPDCCHEHELQHRL